MITRRAFLASLAALPVAVKGFVLPSQAAVVEFQTVYPPTLPIGGTYRLINNGIASDPIAYNATPAEIQKALNGIIRRGGNIPLSGWGGEPPTTPRANPCLTMDSKRTAFDELEFEYIIDGYCSSCQHEYRITGACIADTETVAWDCPHCGKVMTRDIMEFFK